MWLSSNYSKKLTESAFERMEPHNYNNNNNNNNDHGNNKNNNNTVQCSQYSEAVCLVLRPSRRHRLA